MLRYHQPEPQTRAGAPGTFSSILRHPSELFFRFAQHNDTGWGTEDSQNQNEVPCQEWAWRPCKERKWGVMRDPGPARSSSAQRTAFKLQRAEQDCRPDLPPPKAAIFSHSELLLLPLAGLFFISIQMSASKTNVLLSLRLMRASGCFLSPRGLGRLPIRSPFPQRHEVISCAAFSFPH